MWGSSVLCCATVLLAITYSDALSFATRTGLMTSLAVYVTRSVSRLGLIQIASGMFSAREMEEEDADVMAQGRLIMALSSVDGE